MVPWPSVSLILTHSDLYIGIWRHLAVANSSGCRSCGSAFTAVHNYSTCGPLGGLALNVAAKKGLRIPWLFSSCPRPPLWTVISTCGKKNLSLIWGSSPVFLTLYAATAPSYKCTPKAGQSIRTAAVRLIIALMLVCCPNCCPGHLALGLLLCETWKRAGGGRRQLVVSDWLWASVWCHTAGFASLMHNILCVCSWCSYTCGDILSENAIVMGTRCPCRDILQVPTKVEDFV